MSFELSAEALGAGKVLNSLPSSVITPQDLRTIKEIFCATSTSAGDVQYLGQIGDSTPPGVWKGPISPMGRLAAGEVTEYDLGVAADLLRYHYVVASEGAAKRCAEDRSVLGFDPDDWHSYLAPLGPQVQGGTADEAVAYRLEKGVSPANTHARDIASVSRRDSKFKPGAHTGETLDPTKTGCGSVDSQTAKVESYRDGDVARAIENKTRALVELGGVALSGAFFDGLTASAIELSNSPRYFWHAKTPVDLVRRHNPQGVPHVQGPHYAFALGVNYVPGTTLHTSEYNAAVKRRTGKDITAFGLDAWHLFEEHGPEGAGRLVAQAVNTLMHLADGSLRLYVRLPHAK